MSNKKNYNVMDIKNTSIGEIVKADYRTSDVFKKYGIDFCCGGGKTLSSVCEAHQLNVEELLKDLNKSLTSSGRGDLPYDEWPVDLLATYIQKIHHKYVEESIPLINGYLDKIVRVHGSAHPELLEIAALFKESAKELTMHMKKEEFMLFPYVQKLVKLKESNASDWQKPVFESVENPIHQMEQEHDHEGERFRKIAQLSHHYTPPKDACNTYSVTYQKLKEFEDDLHLHIHLENNILFPKTKALELSMR